MGNYLSELFSNFGKSLLFFSNMQGIFTLILSILVIIIPSIIPQKKRLGKTKMWNRIKLFWSKSPYRWVVIIVVIMLLSWNVQYTAYKEKQGEYEELSLNMSQLQTKYEQAIEEYRPILTLDPNVTLNPQVVDEIKQMANITINIKVNNIGEKPAYQISSSLYCGPLDAPDKLVKYDNIYNNNPFYKGTENRIIINHIGYYSKNGNVGTIIIRLYIKYNNSPIGKEGIWYYDTYWYAFNIDLLKKTVTLNPPLPDEITRFETYIQEGE